jgi:hypothetical protein
VVIVVISFIAAFKLGSFRRRLIDSLSLPLQRRFTPDSATFANIFASHGSCQDVNILLDCDLALQLRCGGWLLVGGEEG